MRCSECSRIVQPIVAIDIDGTLGDYHTHLIQFMQKYLGAGPWHEDHGFGYDGTIKMSAWSEHIYGIDHKTYEQIKLAYRQGAQKRSMPPYSGVDYLIAEVRDAGAEIWVTTTRPFLRLDGVDPDTRFWLAQNYVDYDGLLYDEDKYRVLAERVDPERVVAVLDDLPEQYDAAADAFGPDVPIFRKQHYNRGVSRPREMESLYDVGRYVHRLIDQWRLQHGNGSQ